MCNHMRQKLTITIAEKQRLQEFGVTNFRILLNKIFWHHSQNKWIYLPEEWEFEGLQNGKVSEAWEETWQYITNRNTGSRPSRGKHQAPCGPVGWGRGARPAWCWAVASCAPWRSLMGVKRGFWERTAEGTMVFTADERPGVNRANGARCPVSRRWISNLSVEWKGKPRAHNIQKHNEQEAWRQLVPINVQPKGKLDLSNVQVGKWWICKWLWMLTKCYWLEFEAPETDSSKVSRWT